MSHGFDPPSVTDAKPLLPGILGGLQRFLGIINAAITFVGGFALVGAALVLSYSVVTRYVFRWPTDWQDEMAVFLIIGACFMAAAAVQARRGHVAIEAFTGLLGAKANRLRLLLIDALSLLFCAYLTEKCLRMLHEVWAENQHTESSWGPPLWIPYGFIAIGLVLLCLQILIHILEALFAQRPRR
jgi:TRAP-type C4-dicarboxylate transport system permease small subunit